MKSGAGARRTVFWDSQPVFTGKEVFKRGHIPSSLLFPVRRIFPHRKRIEEFGKTGKNTFCLKRYPCFFGLNPSATMLHRVGFEELVKGQRGLTGRDVFRLLIFLRAFNARARVKHTSCIYSFFL